MWLMTDGVKRFVVWLMICLMALLIVAEADAACGGGGGGGRKGIFGRIFGGRRGGGKSMMMKGGYGGGMMMQSTMMMRSSSGCAECGDSMPVTPQPRRMPAGWGWVPDMGAHYYWDADGKILAAWRPSDDMYVTWNRDKGDWDTPTTGAAMKGQKQEQLVMMPK